MVSPTDGESDHLASPFLLRKIDQLRERNIGQHIALPQLVVVGDQSSGKSSLLESLMGIPFPRSNELCTRYVTQITSRRDAHSSIDVSIIPGPNASDAHRKLVGGYRFKASYGRKFRDVFPGILKDVNSKMGIRVDVSSPNGVIFSQDVLKIEICGPDEDYLTVIDVPGIFRTPTEGITTKEDMALVKKMVKAYIKDSRTIILAVLASNIDVSNQEILTLAEDYDKTGERTLGVFTKPDLVTERTAKFTLCDGIRGKKKKLTLGYHVVRNRGADDMDDTDEDRELMFLEEPWRSLPADRVGVRALKTRLTALLGHIARQGFPEVRKEIRSRVQSAQKELEGLGPSRGSEREQRLFLSGIARQFQDLTRASLVAHYSGHQAFEGDQLRLITHVVRLTDVFSHDMKTKGHHWNFEDSEDIPMPSMNCRKASDSEEISLVKDNGSDVLTSPDDLSDEMFPELDSIITHSDAVDGPEDGIMDWIKDLHLGSRSVALGSFGEAVLSSAFKEQSSKWDHLATAYASKVIVAIHRFIDGALGSLCVDAQVHEALFSAISDELLRRYKAAMDQTFFLVSLERDKRPYTLNHSFARNLQIARGHRMADRLEDRSHKEARPYTSSPLSASSGLVVGLEEIRTVTEAKDNVEDAIEQIHDILSSYYKVARDRFDDNVYCQVVDYCLLTGPESPLVVLTQEWVLRLGSDQLSDIAGESPATRGRRESLTTEIRKLHEAMEILKH